MEKGVSSGSRQHSADSDSLILSRHTGLSVYPVNDEKLSSPFPDPRADWAALSHEAIAVEIIRGGNGSGIIPGFPRKPCLSPTGRCLGQGCAHGICGKGGLAVGSSASSHSNSTSPAYRDDKDTLMGFVYVYMVTTTTDVPYSVSFKSMYVLTVHYQPI